MLTRGEFVARVIVLRFLLVKTKMVSIKTAHALYRDNGPLSRHIVVKGFGGKYSSLFLLELFGECGNRFRRQLMYGNETLIVCKVSTNQLFHWWSLAKYDEIS